jgi:hypothetical protein
MGYEIFSNFMTRGWLFSGEIMRGGGGGDFLFARLVLFPLFSGFELGNAHKLSEATSLQISNFDSDSRYLESNYRLPGSAFRTPADDP